MAVKLNSLKARLISSALVLVLVFVPLVGLAIHDAFSQQVKSSANAELKAYLLSLLAVAEVEDGQLQMPEAMADDQFNLVESGLYAVISANWPGNRQELWRSASYLGPSPSLPAPPLGIGEFDDISMQQQRYLSYSFSVSFELSGQQALPVTLHILKVWDGYQQQIDVFSGRLMRWLGLLMLLLLIIQLAWLTWTLRPLGRFRSELSQVEQGKASQLSSDYPNELNAVASQLNTLLLAEQNQRSRYRNALSDLAHGLKTPLAVIQSQPNLDSNISEQAQQINRIIDRQLGRAQAGAGVGWHQGVELTPVVQQLLRTLAKVYHDTPKQVQTDIAEQAQFHGDQQDLLELLGNLLDNAYKAAATRIHLSATVQQRQLVIVIADDGPGISLQQQAQIFERGVRSDSYQQGHGIGLAIVRDLVDSYQGELMLADSDALGGAEFTLRFPL